jgi:hypothetical protein
MGENCRIVAKLSRVRVVYFGRIEHKVGDYLATDIPEEIISNQEIAEAYR